MEALSTVPCRLGAGEHSDGSTRTKWTREGVPRPKVRRSGKTERQNRTKEANTHFGEYEGFKSCSYIVVKMQTVPSNSNGQVGVRWAQCER